MRKFARSLDESFLATENMRYQVTVVVATIDLQLNALL